MNFKFDELPSLKTFVFDSLLWTAIRAPLRSETRLFFHVTIPPEDRTILSWRSFQRINAKHELTNSVRIVDIGSKFLEPVVDEDILAERVVQG